MLASLQPNSPTSEQAVRDLIDQRARASHTRYSSASYSQRSDSPSIYSRGDLSPNTQTHPQGEWISQSDQMSLRGQNQSGFDDDEDDSLTTFTRSSFDRDDQVSLPPADDDISIFSIPTPKAPAQPISVPSPLQDLDIDVGSPGTEPVEEGPRMSMLGPKMRFVSKAPWELGEDDLAEEEDEEPGSATDTLSIFGSKMSSWRNKDQDKSSPKGLGLATLRSRSPGFPSASSRKGSGGTSSSMFRHETQREGPYGPHLASASQSHGAIPSTFASSTKSLHSMTDSLSSDHPAHRYTHGLAKVAVPTEPFSLPPHAYQNQNMAYSSRDEYATSRSESPPPLSRYIHPYANPDLLSMTASEHSTASLPRTPGTSFDGPSEGETQRSPLRRVSESATSSPPRGTSMRKASAGGLALPAMPSKTTFGEHTDNNDMAHLVARPNARTSSKPIPTSPARSMVSYGDQPGSHMHNLITLEQARARAQNTSKRGPGGNNAVAPTPRSTPSSTLVAGLGLAPGVVVESSLVRGHHPNPQSLPLSDPSSRPTGLDQRSGSQQRPRAMSTGKHIIGNAAGGSGDGDVIPAKTLKHKKSAFMKLFQGKDRERERDNKETVSPAPGPVRAMSTPPQLPPPNDSSVPPLPNIHSIKRVPPPLPLSVVITSPSFPPSGSPPAPSQGDTSMRLSPPRLRQASAPASASSPPPTQPFTQDHDNQLSNSLGPEFSRPTASAPPTQMSFEALSLRPVSTIFSAKFPDLLSPSSPVDTCSAATARRLNDPPPLTPGFSSSRSNSTSTSSDYPVTPTSFPITGPPSLGPMPGEDQSNVIASLHEQITNSRKAWQRQIWELEGQVRDLKAEVEELRNTGECDTCGMAKRERRIRTPIPQNVSVVDRPRPRLGGGNTRSVFGGGCDM